MKLATLIAFVESNVTTKNVEQATMELSKQEGVSDVFDWEDETEEGVCLGSGFTVVLNGEQVVFCFYAARFLFNSLISNGKVIRTGFTYKQSQIEQIMEGNIC